MLKQQMIVMAVIAFVGVSSAYAEDPVEATTERAQERVRVSAEEGEGAMERVREENTQRYQNRKLGEAEAEQAKARNQLRVQEREQAKEAEPSEPPGFFARLRNAFGGGEGKAGAGDEAQELGDVSAAPDADRDRRRDRDQSDDPDRDRDQLGNQEPTVEQPEHDRDRDRDRELDHDRMNSGDRSGAGGRR